MSSPVLPFSCKRLPGPSTCPLRGPLRALANTRRRHVKSPMSRFHQSVKGLCSSNGHSPGRVSHSDIIPPATAT
jgi:hypothetical protein